MLDISPVSLQQDDGSAVANATKTRQVGDITLCYDKTEYMFVPADYKPTDAELNREKTDPHFTISYGSDKVRFPTPVPVGSRIRGGFELVSLDEIPLGRQARTKVTIHTVPGAKHGDVLEVGGPALWRVLGDWLAGLDTTPGAAAEVAPR